jgi:hypothetical protein
MQLRCIEMNQDAGHQLISLVPEYPARPQDEVPRDALLKFITQEFGASCQKQLIVSGELTGKSNFMSQFCRYHSNRAVSYFATRNPMAQNLHTYLYVMCNQIRYLLHGEFLSEGIALEELKGMFVGFCNSLVGRARRDSSTYFYVVDGLDYCLSGDIGDRIVDFLPLTFPAGPYCLLSCRPASLKLIPGAVKDEGLVRQNADHSLVFNVTDTRHFLSSVDLSHEEVEAIHVKSGGLPGYLRIIVDAIRASGKEWISTDELPDSVEQLARQHIDRIYSGASPSTKQALEMIAVAPTPIGFEFLLGLLGEDPRSGFQELVGSGIVRTDEVTGSYSITPDVVRQALLGQLGSRRPQILLGMTDRLRSMAEPDDLLLTLLLRETGDYEGLVDLLDIRRTMATVDRTKNVNEVVRRMEAAATLARDRDSLPEQIRWARGVTCIRELQSHSVNSLEIVALVSIGEFKEALRRIYSLPDLLSKTRLLGRTYSEMKQKGEVVQLTAIEELRQLLTSPLIADLDKESAQDLAIDILGVLPDEAVAIVDRTMGEHERQSFLHMATYSEMAGTNLEADLLAELERPEFGPIRGVYAQWLGQLDFARLTADVNGLKNTKSKEFIIREWCRLHRDGPGLGLSIRFWLDTVVGDTAFTIALRSLRQVSALLRFLPSAEIPGIVARLEVPTFNSIRTPWQEWTGFQLNLAEAAHSYSPESAYARFDEVYETLNLRVEDRDVKLFCYARLWKSASRIRTELEQELKLNFQRILSELLSHSAIQDDILRNTLQLVAEVDVEYALEVAAGLNTEGRRNSAITNVLAASLRKNPGGNLSGVYDRALDQLEPQRRQFALVRITQELLRLKGKLAIENQAVLLHRIRQIKSPRSRAECLANLSLVWDNESIIRTEKLVDEALRAWSEIEDLRARIVLGFELVERIAEKAPAAARKLCGEVQRHLTGPGGELASGDLGIACKNSIELAIQSLRVQDFAEEESNLEAVLALIRKFPSRLMSSVLLADVAARAYSVGNDRIAGDLVSRRVVPTIQTLAKGPSRDLALEYAFPVIFRHQGKAASGLIAHLPEEDKNRTWYSCATWQITLGPLREYVDGERVKNTCSVPDFQNFIIPSIEQISWDAPLYSAIVVGTKSIERSFSTRKLDATAAYDLLVSLDEIAKSRLPDPKNISHEGFLVIAQARIQATRSLVKKELRKKGRFGPLDLGKGWAEIERRARAIPNTADRVYVANMVAKELHSYNPDRAKSLLSEAGEELSRIPAIIDRCHRIGELLQTWGLWGEGERASFLIREQVELMQHLDDRSRDERIELLVQAAYEISPELADKIVSAYSSRFPERPSSELKWALKGKELAKQPGKIGLIVGGVDLRDIRSRIVGAGARKLYRDATIMNSVVPSKAVLSDWVNEAMGLDESANYLAMLWITDCLNRQVASRDSTSITNHFIDSAELVYQLAKRLSPGWREGAPEEVIDYLPGLSSRVEVFMAGEEDRAKKFVMRWLRDHAEEYLKIVDPYFGPEEIEYLADLPREVKVLIVTTSKPFEDYGAEDYRQALLEQWRLKGKGDPPKVTLQVVPKGSDQLFHDRAIITKTGGLDVGNSLNGLGKKTGKVVELHYEDAKDLEAKFIDEMLSDTSWYLKHDVQPLRIYIGQ